MKTYKTEGIALKSIKLGEADKIITFLTTDGKVAAVAKGIRRTTSKIGGRLEPGNDLEMVLARGRNLDTVTQVQIKKARPWLRVDLSRLEIAFAIFEMAEKLATEKSPEGRLLGLVAATLDRLEQETRLSLLLLTFDLKALAITGFLPNLNECVVCGDRQSLSRISIADGGLICEKCYSAQLVGPFNESARELTKKLLAVKLSQLDSVIATKGIISIVRDMLSSHIKYHVHAELKARTKDS